MKTRTLISIMLPVLAVLTNTVSSANASDIEMFLQAAKSGDVAEVKRLIESGADVNEQTNDRVTALIIASQEGHPEIAKLLIDAGADVNAQTNDGYTALMLASDMGHTDIVKLLKEAGAK